jgi:hypothetical protein
MVSFVTCDTQAQIWEVAKFQSTKPGLFGMIAPMRAQQIF